MRRFTALTVLLVFCGFVIADQDDIDLDPGAGNWSVVGGSSLPGARGEIRDDLLDMPDGMERAICYHHPTSGDLKAATKVRYVIKAGPRPEDYQTVTITDQTGNMSGVRVRWNNYIINKKCDHTVTDDCENSGVPPELWGDFVGGKLEVKDKDSSAWITVTTPVHFQKVATAGACAAF